MSEWDGVTPQEALTLLAHMSWGDATATIIRRLSAGLIRSRAEAVIERRSNRDTGERAEDFEIPKAFWASSHADSQSPFWRTGDTTFYGIGRSYSISIDVEYDAFGLTFSRPDIEKLLPRKSAPGGTEVQSSAAAKKPVSEAELTRFMGLFIAFYEDRVTEALAWNAAKSMFPDAAISRDRVRALLPARKPGRPPSRG